ncbi:hypothetical protein [uncultured Friedmanniella sp.]|uniref:hypothetical protein n=1 Tax=uncultured Friedmanniella sp. TaxID=335381 RepID=UPI0035C96299
MAAALTVAVVSGAWLLGGRPAAPTAAPAPTATVAEPTPVPSSPSPTATPARAPSRTPAAGPPKGTFGVDQAYLSQYRARRVDWDDVLASGRRLPRPDAACKASWKKSGKDTRLAWKHGHFWCLADLAGGHWKPQGITGSGSTGGYRIRGHAASSRNLVLISWYSRAAEKGLFAPNRAGQSVTRLMVVDLNRKRYASVELVRPQGADRLRNLNSHGSGLAWAGQYLYSSSRSWLWRYNADDLLRINGHFVLPAVARWSVSGSGGLSSISVDRSTGRDQLVGVNYSKTAPAYVHTFDLGHRGLLVGHARAAGPSLQLTTGFGEKHRVVGSLASTAVPGTHYQGVARWGRLTLANSSSARVTTGGHRSNALVVLGSGRIRKQFRLPRGNVESIYLDRRRKSYLSLTEAGSRFLFTMPLRDVIRAARR